MTMTSHEKGIPVALAAALGGIFAWWFLTGPSVEIEPRLPGADQAGGAGSSEVAGAQAGTLVRYEGVPSAIAGAWPRFRGERFDNISRDETPLARAWGEGGPPVLWRIEVGEGYAGAAILNGRVYFTDYDPPDTWLFRPADVTDWPGLAGTVTAAGAAPAASPGKRLWERLAPEIHTDLEAIAGGGSPDAAGATRILAAFDAVLRDRTFFDPVSFAGIDLPGEVRRNLIRTEDPAGEDVLGPVREELPARELVRLNRVLFEVAWPAAVARSRHGDVVRCLSLDDGRDIWRFAYPVKVKRFHGMTRTVPAVTGDYVLSLGPKCHVVCLRAETGERLWSADLAKEYGTRVPEWYAGQCPLIDGDRAILAPAGPDVLMLAVDCASGAVIWKAPNPNGWKMTHSSIIPMEWKGRRMYLYCASGGITAVGADDGSILWESDAWRIRIANVPSPVIFGDGRIFLSGGYGAGSLMLGLREEGGGIVAETLWKAEPKVFGSAQQTPILYEGFLYGVLPKDAGASGNELVCLDPDGNQRWTSGGRHRFGLGPFAIADGLLYIMDDEGRLAIAKPSPEGFEPLAAAEIFPQGHEAWGPFAFAGGRMIVRDSTRMACLDVSAAAGGGS
ncbi:MAG: PQQ-like beta-propeller repeat protein [Planctomycetes bacterium]|nr:PQQ-like beta-propeller repeat protein [Planctomycetota bacterium]